MQVLLQVPLVGISRQRQLALLVVRLDNVLDNGTRLPQNQVVVVVVLDGGKSAVGVDGREGRLFGVVDGDLGDGQSRRPEGEHVYSAVSLTFS